MINIPTEKQLIAARRRFRELFEAARTPERDWQRFLAENPYVLSLSLPLKLLPSDIHPRGRQGKSEPDFLIYPGSDRSRNIYGVVELKTHHAHLFKEPRKAILDITADLRTAIRQVRRYDQDFDRYAPRPRCLGIGSRSHLFIIIGASQELQELQARPEFRLQLEELLPRSIRFLGFDDVLENFESECPKQVVVAVHGIDVGKSWRERFLEYANDPDRTDQLRLRSYEELVAEAYRRAGFEEVVLIPCSVDGGRDVIVAHRGFGSVS